METIEVRPDEAQRRLWVIYALVVFAIGAIVCGGIMLIPDPEALLVGGIALVAWCVIMLLIVLYLGAYWRTLRYVIEDDSVEGEGGVFFTKHVTVPYSKVTNVDLTQGPFQRMLQIANIHVQTAGAGGAQGARAELKLCGLRDAAELRTVVTRRARAVGRGPAAESTPAEPPEGRQELLQSILRELTAIRELLEQGRP